MNPTLVVLLSLCGQQLTLPPEVKAEAGELVVITATTDCKTLEWLSPDPAFKLIPAQLLRDSRVAVGLTRREGTFAVYAWGAKGDVPTPAAVCKVVVGKGTPDKPPPPPPPQAKLQVTVVTDADHVDAKLAELLRDQTLRKALDQQGHTLRLYDTTSRVLDAQQLRPVVNSVGLPALIVQQPTGQVIRGLRVPETVPAFLDACRP